VKQSEALLTPPKPATQPATMKALVYHGPGRRSWEDKPRPAICEATDALVRITTATICGTDLHILKGDVPTVSDGRILGHEGIGVVEETGAAVAGFEGQLGVFRGWEPGKPCYRCFVGGDPERPEMTCADQGVLGALTGVLGSLAALETVRALAPFGDDPAGKLLLVDALGFRFRMLGLPKDPGCPGCGNR